MAFKLAELFTELTVRGAGKVRSEVRGLKSDFAKLGVSGTNVAAGVTAALALAGVASVKFLQEASAAEETLAKFGTVFKEETQAAEDFANVLANKTNRSVLDLRKSMAGFQDTFVPLGFARKEARLMAQQVTELAVDLASFNNVAQDDAVRDLQSALVGNSETVRKYGVILNEANIQQEAFRITGKQNKAELSNAEKAQARLNLILGGTKDAQGDAAKTAGSLANQYRATEAAARDVAVAIGQALTPAAVEMLGTTQELLPQLKDLFSTMGEGRKLVEEMSGGVAILVKNLGDLASITGLSQLNELRKGAVDVLATGLTPFVGAEGGFQAPDVFSEQTQTAFRLQGEQAGLLREMRKIEFNTQRTAVVG